MDGLGLLYSEEEVSKAIAESRKILKRYKALKLREKLENRSPKSPVISDMPRGGQKRPDSAYDNFVNLISQTYPIGDHCFSAKFHISYALRSHRRAWYCYGSHFGHMEYGV